VEEDEEISAGRPMSCKKAGRGGLRRGRLFYFDGIKNSDGKRMIGKLGRGAYLLQICCILYRCITLIPTILVSKMHDRVA
jgi:hypothetical protein